MKNIWKKFIVFAVSGTLFGGFAGGAFVGVTAISKMWIQEELIEEKEDRNEEKDSQDIVGSNQTPTVAVNAQNDASEENNASFDVSDIAKIAMPSIVAITNKSVQEVQSYFSMFGRGNQVIQQEVELSLIHI